LRAGNESGYTKVKGSIVTRNKNLEELNVAENNIRSYRRDLARANGKSKQKPGKFKYKNPQKPNKVGKSKPIFPN
jgi:hypothetical protein